MKSIFFLSVMNGSAWGGSEELWYQAALWCAKNGYNTGVCCFDWEGKRNKIKILQESGCNVYLLPGKDIIRKRPFLGKRRIQQLLAKVPFEKYDFVVVSQGGWKDVAHSPFKKLYLRLKDYVLLYHNYNVLEKFSASRSVAMKAWVNKAKFNMGDTEKIFLAMGNSYRLQIPRQLKLYNPLTFSTPAEPSPFPPLHENFIFSVFAALDTERKAQEILVKALSTERWKSENWQLYLYGEGKDRLMLEKLIKELQLQHKIFLAGNAGNYQEAIKKTHLVLQVTHIDAMPITVMDALAMARPLIVSETGDMPNWIVPGLNGYITEKVTEEAIDQSLSLAWKEKEHWQEMGLASYRIFREKFPDEPIPFFLSQAGFL